jgi:histone-lysine N-methyltransferase SETMAR
VPHELTPGQKQQRETVCLQLLRRQRQGHFLSRFVTTDESWVCYDGRVRKPQWLSPNEKPDPVPKPDPHGKKRMLSVFWSISGPVYWELLPRNTIVNSDLYCHLLETVNAVLTDERLEGRRHGQVVFHQDNARPHTSNETQDKIRYDLGWDLVSHPPYSPDLAPSDFHLFRSLKNFLRGRRFRFDHEVDFAVEEFFASKQGTDFFKRGIQKLPIKWRTVVNTHGEYLI